MAQTNQISTAISDNVKLVLENNLANIASSLSTTLIFNLSPEERTSMLKMGDKTLAFVTKAIEYARQNPALVPQYLNLAEAQKDLTLTQDLFHIYQKLTALTRAVEDTMMVAGGEAYEAALIFYNSVKGAARSNAAGSQAIYEEMKQRFPGRPKKADGNDGADTAA